MPIERSLIDPTVKIHHESMVNIYDSVIKAETAIAAFVEIGGASIGRRCKIQAFAFIPPGTVILDDVFIGPHVCFTNVKYPRAYNDQRSRIKHGGIHIGNGVTIGANATILPGIRIGDNAVIGAGAVVTKDVQHGEVVTGNPARHMKSIGDEWKEV